MALAAHARPAASLVRSAVRGAAPPGGRRQGRRTDLGRSRPRPRSARGEASHLAPRTPHLRFNLPPSTPPPSAPPPLRPPPLRPCAPPPLRPSASAPHPLPYPLSSPPLRRGSTSTHSRMRGNARAGAPPRAAGRAAAAASPPDGAAAAARGRAGRRLPRRRRPRRPGGCSACSSSCAWAWRSSTPAWSSPAAAASAAP